jgi:hypothetical protein
MASLKKCVEQMCKTCTYDHAAPGSWRQQVENCTVKACPLWEVRPVTMETTLVRRKGKAGEDAALNAIIDGLEDDEDEVGTPEVVAA